MRFPPHFLDAIRARLPISQVVGRRVSWDKRKSNPGRGDFWACCPFHGEKTPSFHADDRKGRYHCFGCGVSGDHFTFLVEQEGLSFPDAVAQLATEAGVPMPERDPGSERREAERASLHDVLERAARFFEAALQGADGAKARAYLRERGIAPDMQKRFRIGYALASRNAMKEYLAAAGISQEQMIEAGLLIAGDDIPVSYDRFRDRVIFPITDFRGRVIAFGGRALAADAQAKYLNSPETPLFHKSQVLYNGQTARAASRKGGHVIAVEGYIDVIACASAGFDATVAPLGTALTEDQLTLLWQMADEPILCFDGDEAGLKAASRAMDTAWARLPGGKSLRFAQLPPGRDPDDLIRKEGAEAFEKVLENARPLSQMILARELERVDLSVPEHRAALERRLNELAFSIQDKVVARHYRDFFRLRLSELFWATDGKRRNIRPVAVARSLPKNTLEKIIVGICVREPSLFRDHHDEIASINFAATEYRMFFKGLERLLLEFDNASVSDVYLELGDEFYKVLVETHGAGLRRSGGLEPTEETLKWLFPAIRLQPSLVELAQTLHHFILLHRRKQYEAELEAKVGLVADDGAWEAQLRGLQEFRMMVAQSEKELDQVYQRLRFRPANENLSLGTAVLADGNRDWKQLLRAVR